MIAMRDKKYFFVMESILKGVPLEKEITVLVCKMQKMI